MSNFLNLIQRKIHLWKAAAKHNINVTGGTRRRAATRVLVSVTSELFVISPRVHVRLLSIVSDVFVVSLIYDRIEV